MMTPSSDKEPTEPDVAPRLQDAVTEQEVEAPMSRVRSDVSRITGFFRSIHSRYLWFGIVLYLLTFGTGLLLALLAPLFDWYMHMAMYLVIFAFLMIYVRAYQLRRRIARSFYALVTAAMMLFWAWVLVDLIADRLAVIDASNVVHRERLPELMVPVVMLGMCTAWLLFHWLVLSRFQHDE